MISLLHVQHVAISQDIFGLPSPVPPVYKAWHNKLTGFFPLRSDCQDGPTTTHDTWCQKLTEASA